MTRTTWCLVGLGALVLLIAWSFRDYATLWRGRWRPLPLQPALSSEARDGDWTMWRGNAQRTGVQAQPGPVPTGQVEWQFVNGAGFISSPIAAGDSLYVGDTQGRLSRLQRSTGKVLWQLQGLGPLDASPALAGDLLYIGLRDGQLLAIQTTDGVIRWRVATGNPIYASPLVHQGVLYIGSGDGLVYALDAVSGMERWRAQTEGWIHSSPALLDDLVYVGSNDGALYFIDRRSGVPRWRYRTSQAIRATPAIAEGLILFGGEDGWFRAIDAYTLGRALDVRLALGAHHALRLGLYRSATTSAGLPVAVPYPCPHYGLSGCGARPGLCGFAARHADSA